MNAYSIAHEQWAWDIRQEPAVIDVFAKVWGTNELLVSFGELFSQHSNPLFSLSTRLIMYLFS